MFFIAQHFHSDDVPSLSINQSHLPPAEAASAACSINNFFCLFLASACLRLCTFLRTPERLTKLFQTTFRRKKLWKGKNNACDILAGTRCLLASQETAVEQPVKWVATVMLHCCSALRNFSLIKAEAEKPTEGPGASAGGKLILRSHLRHWWSPGAQHQAERTRVAFFYVDGNSAIAWSKLLLYSPYIQSSPSRAWRWKAGTVFSAPWTINGVEL